MSCFLAAEESTEKLQTACIPSALNGTAGPETRWPLKRLTFDPKGHALRASRHLLAGGVSCRRTHSCHTGCLSLAWLASDLKTIL